MESRTDPGRRFVIADPIHPSSILTLCAEHHRVTKALAIVASTK
jgi:hypothetical protein